MTESFHAKLCEEIERFCPKTVRSINYSKLRREPWVTNGILKSIKKAKALYKETLINKCTDNDIARSIKSITACCNALRDKQSASTTSKSVLNFEVILRNFGKQLTHYVANRMIRLMSLLVLKINNIRNYNAKFHS